MSASTSTKSSSKLATDRGARGCRPHRDVDIPRRRPKGQAWRAVIACGTLAAAVAGCSKSSDPAAPQVIPSLPLLATHHLTITEPSDLAIDETGTMLWTVTNNPEKVYQLDLNGQVVKQLSYTGNNLEGIVYDRRDSTLWLAEENKREVVHIDLSGAVIAKYPLALTGELNSGLEGICLSDSGAMFVLNEKNPGLFITLAPDLTISSLLLLSFAKDYSGMTYDVPRRTFWVVSDQSQRLYRWTPNTVLAEYSLPFPKPEGVAYDPVANRIYVVSDSTSSLYVFDSSPAATSTKTP